MIDEFPKGRQAFIRRGRGRSKFSVAELERDARFNRRLLAMRLEGQTLQSIANYYEMSIGAAWPRIEKARAEMRNEAA